jgi:hypothetical protein
MIAIDTNYVLIGVVIGVVIFSIPFAREHFKQEDRRKQLRLNMVIDPNRHLTDQIRLGQGGLDSSKREFNLKQKDQGETLGNVMAVDSKYLGEVDK